MNHSTERFLELDAGRTLGNLSSEEEAKWQELKAEHGETASESIPLDQLVTAVKLTMKGEEQEAIPFSVKASAVAEAKQRKKITPISEKKPSSWIARPGVGWAVAACFAIAFFVKNSADPNSDGNSAAIVAAVDQDSGANRLQFARLEASHGELNGEVVWSDQLQKGYMKLTGLNPNDPAAQQFQLWIFDPERDENPVDGGVFNVASNDTIIIPINAKLEINEPNAFAITVEQPGGVVVSKREMLIALAK